MTPSEATTDASLKLTSAASLTPQQAETVMSFFVHDVAGNIAAAILVAMAVGAWRWGVKRWRNHTSGSTPTPPE
ncbi:hypothetical protein [Streptomyces sp. NPDC056361]|uniref:hypothetical protein n=1 Tax=Streptomyces sp. NPDC056361 TaxID=3345795 RepID=UPI0035E1EC0E